MFRRLETRNRVKDADGLWSRLAAFRRWRNTLNILNLVSRGLGSGLDPAAEPSQRFPAGVGWTLIAGTRLAVAVLTAARAKSFAVRLAQGSDRQGQKHLLTQHIFKQQTVSLIITDFGFRRSNGAFEGLGIGLGGAEDEVEVSLERDFDGLDAASAGDLEAAGKAALEADVCDDVAGSAVLVEDLGAASGGQGADLLGFLAQIDGSGGSARSKSMGSRSSSLTLNSMI